MPTFPLKRNPAGTVGGRYLVDQKGVPFLFCGDAPWWAATKLGTTDAASYLDNAVSRGVTSILVEAIDNTGGATSDGKNADGNLPFTLDVTAASYTNATTQLPRFDTTNNAYWNRVDTFMSQAQARSLLVLFYPFWIGNPITGQPGNEGYYSALANAANTQAIRKGYGNFLGNRYKSFANIIWVLGGDNSVANGSSIPAICNDIQSGIADQTLGYNTYPPLFSGDFLDGDSPLTQTETTWGGSSANFVRDGINNVYTDILVNSDPYTYANCKAEWQRSDFPNVPYFQKEGAYQNGQVGWTNQIVRSQTWYAMLGGACGYHWGSQPAWLFGTGWQADFASSRASLDHQTANWFFSTRRWDLLVPDWGNTLLTNGGSYTTGNFVGAALAADASWAALYTPSSQSLTVAMSVFHGTVTAYWVDPTNGAMSIAGQFAASGSHTFSSTPGTNAAGDADWVLEVRGQKPKLGGWAG